MDQIDQLTNGLDGFNETIWTQINLILKEIPDSSLDEYLAIIDKLFKLLLNFKKFDQVYGLKILENFEAINYKIQVLLSDESISKLNVDQMKSYIKNWSESLQISTSIINDAMDKQCYEFITKLKKLPQCLIKNLYESMKFCEKSREISENYLTELIEDLRNLFQNSQNLHTKLIEIADKLDLTYVWSKQDSFLSLYLSMCQTVTSLDLETMFNAWNGFLKFTDEDSLNEINDSIEFIINEIRKNFTEILEINSVDTIQLQLKTANLLLKILLKLLNKFSEDSIIDDNIKAIFELLLNFNKQSKPYLTYKKMDTNLLTLIENYVLIGGQLLLGNLTRNSRFTKHFFANIVNLTNMSLMDKLGWLLLIVNIQKNLLLNCDYNCHHNWLSCNQEHNNLICVMLNYFKQCHTEFLIDLDIETIRDIGNKCTQVSLYELLLIRTAALILQTKKEQLQFLEQIFYKVLFEGNFWPSIFVVDLWSTIVRYSNPEFCKDLFYNNLLIYEKLYTDFTLTTRMFITVLLRQVFNCLSKIDQDNVIQKHLPITVSNLHFWDVVNISLFEKSEYLSYQESMFHFFNNAIVEFLNKIKHNTFQTIKEVKFLICILKLINKFQFNNHKLPLIGNIFKLWSWITLPILNNIHGLLLFSLCEVTCKCIHLLNEDQLSYILEVCNRLIEQETTKENYDQIIPTITLIVNQCIKTFKKLNDNQKTILLNMTVKTIEQDLNSILKEQCLETCNQLILSEWSNDNYIRQKIQKFIKKNKTSKNISMEFEQYLEEQKLGLIDRNQKWFDDLIGKISKNIYDLNNICENHENILQIEKNRNNLKDIFQDLKLIFDQYKIN